MFNFGAGSKNDYLIDSSESYIVNTFPSTRPLEFTEYIIVYALSISKSEP